MSFHDWRLVHGSGKLTTPQPKPERLPAGISFQPSAPAWGYSPTPDLRSPKPSAVFGPQNPTSPPHRAAALRFTCARRTLCRWAGLTMSSRGRTTATGLTLMGLRRLGAGEQSCNEFVCCDHMMVLSSVMVVSSPGLSSSVLDLARSGEGDGDAAVAALRAQLRPALPTPAQHPPPPPPLPKPPPPPPE